MDAPRRPRTPSLTAALIALIVLLAAAAGIVGASVAAAAGVGTLTSRIGSGETRASHLSGRIGAETSRIEALGRSIATLQTEVAAKQSALDAKIAELHRTQAQYAVTHARLLALESYEGRAERVLRAQIVGQYETQQPNLMTVILDARGFQDLLERIQFAQRIQRAVAQVVSLVRASRRAVSAAAVRLGALEVREQGLAAQVLSERDELLHTEIALDDQRAGVARSRATAVAQLTGIRDELANLRAQVAQIQAAQAAAAQRAAALAAQRAAATATPTPTPTPTTAGSTAGSTATQTPTTAGSTATQTPAATGTTTAATTTSGAAPSQSGFTFPLPTSAAAPEGDWSLDDGVDISAPGGTPEYAVCSGTIVLHGIGGFGPWAPVLHCDSPIDGYSYVYYGHAGPANQLPVGTHVSAGQVMSEVGPGIVGISSGPHVEMGFCDASGDPLGGGTAPTMLALLKASY